MGRGEKGRGGGGWWRGASVSDHVGDGTWTITLSLRCFSIHVCMCFSRGFDNSKRTDIGL